MRFEHGRRQFECLLIVPLLLLLCCRPAAPYGAALLPGRQCLQLDESVPTADACRSRDVRLRYCDHYSPAALLLPDRCDEAALARLRRLDREAGRATCRFRALLDRYDCENANSVSWTCKNCEEAYKQWVCAMLLPPVQVEGEGLKPCRYICRMVEQRCPYFHPSVKDQYAGERVFKCIDPDIPDLDSIMGASSYGAPHRCYCPQHLGATEGEGDLECRPPRRPSTRRASAATRPQCPCLLLAVALTAAVWWTRTR